MVTSIGIVGCKVQVEKRWEIEKKDEMEIAGFISIIVNGRLSSQTPLIMMLPCQLTVSQRSHVLHFTTISSVSALFRIIKTDHRWTLDRERRIASAMELLQIQFFCQNVQHMRVVGLSLNVIEGPMRRCMKQ